MEDCSMLFHVKMTVKLPADMPASQAARLKSDEKALAMRLQQDGVWRHLWRIAGHYANYSVFDVPSVEALHDTLMQLPLFPYMDIEIAGLCRHPSSIHRDDR
jgi:muconolactone D-isomerase